MMSMSLTELGFCFWATKCESNARIDGKTVIITGGNTGIGKITAIDLAERGARIVICCRNQQRAEKAVEEIKVKSGSENVQSYEMDLASLQSVRNCAAKILANESRIDVLINNAGIMMVPYSKTVDGYESQFATNHLGHFLFTLLLYNKIKESNSARIINLSSMAHRTGPINLDDLNCETYYNSRLAYSNSKLANVLFSRELAKRTKDTSIRVYCVHPGFVQTELARNIDSSLMSAVVHFLMRWIAKTPEQGAQTTIYCAVSEEVADQTGLYYYECASQQPSPEALDDEIATKLWEISVKMVGLETSPV